MPQTVKYTYEIMSEFLAREDKGERGISKDFCYRFNVGDKRYWEAMNKYRSRLKKEKVK